MREKALLKSVIRLLSWSDRKIFWFRLYFLLGILVALFLLFYPQLTIVGEVSCDVRNWERLALFFVGALFAKWSTFSRFLLVLPHIDKNSVHARLQKLEKK